MVRLGDICEVVSGTTPRSNVEEYWDGTINWITPAELSDDSQFIYESQRKITALAVEKTALSPFPAGTVLLSSRAPIGKVAIAGVEMYCNQGFKNLICSERIHNKYLFWFLKGKTDFLNSLGRGATFKEISKSIVENIEIPLPPIETQIQYAISLDKLSRVISLRKQQLAKLDELVKARFVEMFGDPVNNSHGWKRKRFDAICENLDSRRIPITASDRSQGPYPYYGASGIVDHVNDFIFDEDILLISEDGANLVARVTPIAFSVSGKVWVNNHAHVVRFEHHCTQIYVEHYFALIDISDCITGTAQPKLNQAKLNAMMIPIPDIDIQRKFSLLIEEIGRQKLTIQQSLDKMEVLKKSLMQEYFMG